MFTFSEVTPDVDLGHLRKEAPLVFQQLPRRPTLDHLAVRHDPHLEKWQRGVDDALVVDESLY